MATYKFSDEAVSNALNAAKQTHENHLSRNLDANISMHRGCLSLVAECVSIKVENNQVCVELPLGLGKHCISLPVSIPDGTAGKACLTICTTFGIPTGVKVSVEIAGVTVVSQSFGKC